MLRQLLSRCRGVLLVVVLTVVACSPATAPQRDSDGSRADRKLSFLFTAIDETAEGYAVTIEPDHFVSSIDNPYFPLEPGRKWVLKGKTVEGNEVDTIEVLDETREVMGVTTTVVLDIVTINGEVHEKTWDWYAQDTEGNVWYFGEDTAEYENGKKVSTSGAWEAGVDGALPGIIMSADPHVTDSYRQEYYEGEAEDMFWVVETGVSKETPYGTFEDVVRSLEWSPLEPKIVVEKYHAPGVGLIVEKALSGGTEIFELVKFSG